MSGHQRVFRLKPITAQGSFTPNLINIPKLLSEVNSKYVGHTTSDGDALSFPYRLVFKSTGLPDPTTGATERVEIITTEIPNTWKMRNAVKKWHFARREMFSRAGVSVKELGRYGKLLRPYMDSSHKAGSYDELDTFDYGTVSGASWAYTDIASNLDWPTGIDIGSLAQLDMIDTYKLHVCDDSVIQDTFEGVIEYSSVGMIASYNQDRLEVQVSTAATSFDKNNPLASLKSNDATGGEVSDLAMAQQVENPPYDLADTGTSVQTLTTGLANAVNTGGVFSTSGLAALGYILLSPSSSAVGTQVYLEIGEPILSKDC